MGWVRILSGLSRSKVHPLAAMTDHRYQRDELYNTEKWEELRKRTDKEIADAEKKSAIRRKVEEAKKKAAEK